MGIYTGEGGDTHGQTYKWSYIQAGEINTEAHTHGGIQIWRDTHTIKHIYK